MRKACLLFLPLLLCVFVFSFHGCREELPVISSIEPRIGRLGDILTIRGEHFGSERNESVYITIAGAAPTNSSYVSWQDDFIQVRVPEFAEAGLVYVHRGPNKSNPALFSNIAAMPEPVLGTETGSSPRISSLEPNSGPVGSLITIFGNNFGSSREGAGVWFSWDAEAAPSAPAEIRSANAVAVLDADFGYELWSEREIRVRVPDGAISGNLEVRTPKGNSLSVFFDVTGKPGTKTFKDMRSYTLSYTTDIVTEDAETPNSLYLWLPRPAVSSSQPNVELLSRSMEPYVENYRGTSLYRLANLRPGDSARITLSYVADVYAVETSVRPQNIKQDENSPIHTIYTQPASLIPSDNPEIIARAAAITGRERNPYNKAKLIYDWLIKEGGIQGEALQEGAVEALEEKKADSYRAALLFCALARASGVPALPAAGVLVDRRQRTSRHYWAEFWIDALGWIPVDPALGAGIAPADFNLREDHAVWYFGNLDSQRVAFSRGQTTLSQMDPRGRTSTRRREFTLQNLWEEATGGLESYSSLWSDVIITGVYIR
jgi:transglutaminase-like putative cysteine protease